MMAMNITESQNQIELLHNAIRTTRDLRTSVQKCYGDLCDGMKDGPDKEKVLLSGLQGSLLKINNNLGELEKAGGGLQSGQLSMTLGNTGNLSLDPVIDKAPTYTQLLQSYKWSNKVAEHANHVVQLLGQNSLKRSSSSAGGGYSKRLRKVLPTTHIVQDRVVDQLVAGLDRMFADMSVVLTRPLGSSAVLQITVGRTLKAVAVMRGLLVESVTVRGYGEEMFTPEGKLDIWGKSEYLVFQKISDHASSAMLHFYSPLIPDIAVKSFMTWLHSYHQLFSTPCVKCHKHLVDNVPPTWRDFRNLDAYHEGCRP